jgi:branched-chain amino acid transport system ATP-binding protein
MSPAVPAPALATIGLSKQFGAVAVASDIHFCLETGARHALIGPNGAGKTTFVNLLTGRIAPSAGRILLNGRDVTRIGQSARARLGLARTFQINNLFPALSVLENVRLAVAEHRGLTTGRRALIEEAYATVEQLGLGADALAAVRALPYGKQRLVEIAIAIALKPAVLLLDEPAAGVPGSESGIVLDTIAQLPAGMAVLMIEHDMDLVFRFARRITVLVRGAVLAEGTPDEIGADPRVREVYLGTRTHD